MFVLLIPYGTKQDANYKLHNKYNSKSKALLYIRNSKLSCQKLLKPNGKLKKIFLTL